MPIDEILSTVLKVGGLLGGLAAVMGVIVSRRAGIKGDEREARKIEQDQKRDTLTDRDVLIDQLQEEVAGYRVEVAGFRAEMTKVLEQLQLEREYSSLLLEWGYRGAPPPPPARPV